MGLYNTRKKRFEFPAGAVVLGIFCFLGFISDLSYCAAEEAGQTLDVMESTWNQIRPRLRMRTFSELMTPSFSGNGDSVPKPNGSRYAPAHLFNIVWTDYEISRNFRLFYWQRFILTLNANPDFQPFQYLPRDPRFGARWTQVFDVPGLSTSFDVFIQPNVTANKISNQNIVEFGFRTNTSYAIPQSRWSLGLIQEFTSSYLGGGRGPQAYGWVMNWFSYEFSPVFSTQTAFSVPFQNYRGDSLAKWTWDAPGGPYMQNGIGINLNKDVSVAFLLNNYLSQPISMRNTWASMWVSLTIL